MKGDIEKLRNFRKWFNKFIAEDYGKKCLGFAWDCAVCHAHFVRMIFDDFVEDLIVTDGWLRKGNKARLRNKGFTK